MTVPQSMIQQFDALLASGKAGQARSLAERLLAAQPDDPTAVDMLRSALMSLHMPRQALPLARRAAELTPDSPGVWASLCSCANRVGEQQEALVAARRAIELEPSRPSHYVDAAAVMMALGRLLECEELCRDALRQFPTDHDLIHRLSAALLEQGRGIEAQRVLSEALFANPGDVMMAAFQCSAANYGSPVDRAAYIAMHRNFGRVLSLADLQAPMVHTRPKFAAGQPVPGRGKDGRIRVGFVSSDLRTHSCAYFLEPVLRHLSRARFEILCYASSFASDATTRRFQAMVAGEKEDAFDNEQEGRQVRNWRRVAHMTAAECVKQIAEDRIDILIDLNGLTLGTRADVFRLRPAPVQATWLGYPATTGLTTMDYRLVDSITDPPGCEDAAVETLLRIDPCFICYQPPRGALESPPTPMPAAEGGIVFGSFNNLMKFNDDLAALWSRVINAVPGSRLLMKASSLSDEGVRARTRQRFIAAGLDPDRVELLGTIPGVKDHLHAYGRMHVALDTFPYAGTTTTCEAMLMGVPVVTYAPPSPGAMHAHRVGASLLTAAGCPELIATSADEYVRIAASLAADASRLAAYRATMRERLLASALCDQAAFARRFAGALETMWSAFCAGVSPRQAVAGGTSQR